MRVTPAMAALARAEEISPNNSFVKGCREFYTRVGFLTAGQIEALNKVDNRPRRPFTRYTPIKGDKPLSREEENSDPLLDADIFDIPNM